MLGNLLSRGQVRQHSSFCQMNKSNQQGRNIESVRGQLKDFQMKFSKKRKFKRQKQCVQVQTFSNRNTNWMGRKRIDGCAILTRAANSLSFSLSDKSLQSLTGHLGCPLKLITCFYQQNGGEMMLEHFQTQTLGNLAVSIFVILEATPPFLIL